MPERNQKVDSLAVLLEEAGRHRKILFSLREEKIGRAQIRNSGEHFSAGHASVSERRRGGSVLVRMFVKVGSDFNQKIPFYQKMLLNGDKKIIGTVRDGEREFPIVSLEYIHEPSAPFILLSAGMHGNEPASARALEEFLEADIGEYAGKYNFVIFPRMNPVGCARGTRENGNGIDLNRNFLVEKPEEEVLAIQKYIASLNKKFRVAVDMHEDLTDAPAPGFDPSDNPRGMYLYEVSYKEQRAGEKIISLLQADNIHTADNKIIYGEAVRNSVIWSPHSREPLRTGSFTDTYLHGFTDHTFVVETPTCWSFPERVAAHKKALSFILDAQEGVALRDKIKYKQTQRP